MKKKEKVIIVDMPVCFKMRWYFCCCYKEKKNHTKSFHSNQINTSKWLITFTTRLNSIWCKICHGINYSCKKIYDKTTKNLLKKLICSFFDEMI